MKNKKNKIIQLRVDEKMLEYIDSISDFSRASTIRWIIKLHMDKEGNLLNSLRKNNPTNSG